MNYSVGIFDRSAVNRPIPWLAIGFCVCGYLALLGLIGTFSKNVAILGMAAIIIVAVLAGLRYTSRHREWLIVALMLSDQLLAIDMIPEQVQRVGHYLLAILICLPAVPLMKRFGVLKKGGFRLYAIYYCWAVVTLLFTEDLTSSTGRLLVSILLFCAVSVVAFDTGNREDAQKIFERLALGFGVLIGVLAASAVLLPRSVTYGLLDNSEGVVSAGPVIEISRFRGFFGSPNQVGALAMMAIGVACVCWPASRGRKRLGLAVLIALSIVFALMSKSRTPLVALAVGGAAYIVWKYRVRGFLVCAVLALILSSAAGRLMTVDDNPNSERDVSTLSGRTEAWQFALKELWEHPFTGYGYGTESQIFHSPYFPLWYGPWEEDRMSVHDGYLGRAISVGVPALLFWLFIILRPWVSLFGRRGDPWNLKPVALLIVLPVLVHNLTESSASDFGSLIGLIFGLSWAVAERQRLLAAEAARAERSMSSQMKPAIGHASAFELS